MARPLLSHIDLRVRDRVRSKAFYDALLGDLGFIRREASNGRHTLTVPTPLRGPSDFEWFGFTEDASPVPNSNRIAFVATSNDEVDRVADVLRRIGARNLEGPNYDEGPGYYAVFFEDPDGHRLEVCCRTR